MRRRPHSRQPSQSPIRCGHDPAGLRSALCRDSVRNGYALSRCVAPRCRKLTHEPPICARSVPKAALARPLPTRQTRQKGRLNFLYPAPDLSQMTNDGPLSLDEAVTGWLEAGASNTYTLEVVSAGEYTLDLRSDDLDTVLEIEGRGLSLEDDDGGDGTNSRLSQGLAAGSYEVRVRSFGNDGAGTYTLNTRRER